MSGVLENTEAPCNICGRGWPYHHDSCAYKKTAARVAVLETEAAQLREALERLTSAAAVSGETPKCYCGYLGWTVEKYGRVTHKQGCPARTDPWHQGDPFGAAADADRRMALFVLGELRFTLSQAKGYIRTVSEKRGDGGGSIAADLAERLSEVDALRERLRAALAGDVPPQDREGAATDATKNDLGRKSAQVGVDPPPGAVSEETP